jgi:ATP-dependent DNA ligase
MALGDQARRHRAIAVKSGRDVQLYSRTGKSLDKKFPCIDESLRGLPEGAVVDGGIVAFDDAGRPTFQLAPDLQQRTLSHLRFPIRPMRDAMKKAEALCNRRATPVDTWPS